MVKTHGSSFPPSPNLDIITVSFDKLNNTDVFLQLDGLIFTPPSPYNYKPLGAYPTLPHPGELPLITHVPILRVHAK